MVNKIFQIPLMKGVNKMKRLRIGLLLALGGLFLVSVVYAIPALAPLQNVTVLASVPNNSPEITIMIKQLTEGQDDPGTEGTEVSSMNFGTLTHALTGGGDAGVWFSKDWFCVFIYTTSYGHQYQVANTCSGLTGANTAKTLPGASFVLEPDYQQKDLWDKDDPASEQRLQPNGSALGTKASAVTTGKIIYQSEAEASNRIIRAYYSIPPKDEHGSDPYPGWSGIPLSQSPDDYSGTVTITIAAY